MKILLIKTMMIGDVLFVTPAISAIRKRFPHAHIDMLVGNWSKEAVEGNPNIDRVVSYDDRIIIRPKIGALIGLINKLKKEHYDWIISFHRSRRMHLFAFLIGAPVRVGLNYHRSGWLLTQKICSNPKTNRYPVEMYLDIVRALGIEVENKRIEFYLSQKEKNRVREILNSYKISKNDILVGISPGGAINPKEDIAARRWSPQRFAQIGDFVIQEFGAKVVLFGSIQDTPVCKEVYGMMSIKPIDLSGSTTIKELAGLIECCNLLITNDSASLHIAVGVDTSTVSLFGPTSAENRVPNNSKHLFIQSKLPCSPCWHNENKFPGCQNPVCMDDIRSEDVLPLVRRQLGTILKSKN